MPADLLDAFDLDVRELATEKSVSAGLSDENTTSTTISICATCSVSFVAAAGC
ncbi:hypothetical protein [Streptomyces sp. NPDC059080]|uniref:hypothetical protein n=1 Tax=Streptomyces sp. NPDC059080 TaxID=3346718 RepID=UPI0036A808A9